MVKMVKKGVSRISVSVPPALLKKFDKLITQMMLDRSKAIQVAMRYFLTEHGWTYKQKGTATGAIIMIYDHDVKGLEEALTDVQHAHQHIISSSMHIHLSERDCLSVVAVKGEAEAIQNLAKALIANRGVKQLKTAIVSI
jgi:CopG family nickel-responsive transcriptional regulator